MHSLWNKTGWNRCTSVVLFAMSVTGLETLWWLRLISVITESPVQWLTWQTEPQMGTGSSQFCSRVNAFNIAFLVHRTWLALPCSFPCLSVSHRMLFLSSAWLKSTQSPFSSVQSLSHVRLFATPWTAACQASLSIINSQSLLKQMGMSPLSQWCHPIISSSVVPFSHLQSFSESGSFQMSQFFTSSGQSVSISASISVLSMNIQDWFPLGLTGWISLQSKGLSRVFSNTTVQNHQFFSVQLSLGPTLTSIHDYWKNQSFDYVDLCQQSNVSAF